MENSQFRPILFSTPMVQAILEGRKTMTRRAVKPTPIENENYHFEKLEKLGSNMFGMIPNKGIEIDNRTISPFNGIWKCPYEVGDVLWVRETWQIRDSRKPKEIFYKASDDMTCAPWKPSIFMPKEACRIFLKIKSIKVEKLQDISEEDAKAEGVLFDNQFKKYTCYFCETKWHKGSPSCNDGFFNEAIASFYSLWVSINGDESFKANPFVFVYEFEQIEKPLDFIV